MRVLSRPRRGAALLEVLLALVLVTTIASALLNEISLAVRAERMAESAERYLEAQDQLLRVHALMLETELSMRMGASDVGANRVEVQPVAARLYRVEVSPRDGGGPVLSTLVATTQTP